MNRIGPGVPDEEFARGDAPMTKMEIRAVTLAKARIACDARVLDIGAGTGALATDAALACPEGEVVAVERDAAALKLLRANVSRFELGNLTVVEGEAPEALAALGERPFDAALVGGTGGRMAEILGMLPSLLAPGGHVVVNAIGLASLAEATHLLGDDPWEQWGAVSVAVSRAAPIGKDLRFVPLNPVWIVSARHTSAA